jgi:hypothetical protein
MGGADRAGASPDPSAWAKRLRTVEEEASVTNLHELRKRSRTWPVRLIGDADKHMLGPLADHAHDLRSPGDDHDLARPRDPATQGGLRRPGPQAPPAQADDQRRGELQFAAISLGERIYADKPKPLREASRTAGRPGAAEAPAA